MCYQRRHFSSEMTHEQIRTASLSIDIIQNSEKKQQHLIREHKSHMDESAFNLLLCNLKMCINLIQLIQLEHQLLAYVMN